MRSDYFPIHAHSEFSVLDGMGTVQDMVATVAAHGQPGLALTDHGTMAGVLRLYKECAKHGIAPFPGSELYVVTDVNDEEAKTKRYHMGMVALNYEGYRAMVQMSSRSFLRERFYRKPLVDFSDLAEFPVKDGVAVTTGCFFGLVQQTLINQGPAAAVRMTKMLSTWFPHTFVELQHHDIYNDDHNDDELMQAMVDIADEVGLPIVYGQDSHYCDNDHQEAHDLMKDICYFGDGEDFRFPGGPYHLAPTKWLHRRLTDVWDRIEEGHGHLLDLNNVRLPALDNYHFNVPAIEKKPDAKLRRLTDQSERLVLIENSHSAEMSLQYHNQIEHELNVIEHHGFANYFHLVREVCTWMRKEGIVFNIRGSANGSLVCYLVGITEVDPILWGTNFDRFLSIERKKPPDVDIDIASASRDRVINHVRGRFPSMVAIGTYGRMGLSHDVDEYGDDIDTGAVIVQYMAAMRRKMGDKFTGKIMNSHKRPLYALADLDVRKSLGVHAGGYVLPTADQPIDAYLPTALVPSSNTTVTQAVMEDVEDAGYVKLDLLGLRALETLNTCLNTLGKPGMDFSWVPWDDKRTCQLLRSGWHTHGIFQFEGPSTSRGGKEMKVQSTLDAIICLALYRPALMAGGQKDQYLANRGKPKEERPFNLHDFFDPVLEVTDGVMVFQEQVMEVCQSIDMPFDTWNELMKAVKASNDKIDEYAVGIMQRTYPVFIKCCENKSIHQEDADEVWEAITGFTDYGFNRAHATSYGQMAYRSAYLKAHYPLEYLHALLTSWAGTDKEKVYITAARKLNIDIGRPNINTSNFSWSIDPKKKNTLRKGFLTIKGIGESAAAAIIAARPEDGWTDMEHFVESVPARPVSGGNEWKRTGRPNGVMLKLMEAGALTNLGLRPQD